MHFEIIITMDRIISEMDYLFVQILITFVHPTEFFLRCIEYNSRLISIIIGFYFSMNVNIIFYDW